MNYIQPHLLDLNTLLPLLSKHQLLTTSEKDYVMNTFIPAVEKANQLVYSILPRKGSTAYELFVKCLQEETEHLGHQELVRMLHEKCK